jgi:hypothetical protein
MPNFIFTDRNGKPCLIFDLCVIGNVYAHWDLNQNLDKLFELVDSELKLLNKRLISYQSVDFKDEETKRFMIQQSSNIILHLKRFKNFLDEGITKNYKTEIEN